MRPIAHYTSIELSALAYRAAPGIFTCLALRAGTYVAACLLHGGCKFYYKASPPVFFLVEKSWFGRWPAKNSTYLPGECVAIR